MITIIFSSVLATGFDFHKIKLPFKTLNYLSKKQLKTTKYYVVKLKSVKNQINKKTLAYICTQIRGGSLITLSIGFS
ncbi:hypothetical protein SAMN05216294_0347 [Flagellimonas zhangzhouensis]|uniref:Uncharacterized protein n=1 Tax=Flagellimonas zhangzhouensis TaxID=1073328 RepID=A0A1H2V7S5_9FLAO|nr:hypothetical protein SAMN05216294_0347 [Allomuricauda zhangzhouensis]SDW63974.1 hypothetical protein SAMN04487892_1944 [Allomuricauda zhangzhouensis]